MTRIKTRHKILIKTKDMTEIQKDYLTNIQSEKNTTQSWTKRTDGNMEI
jgi:hypothetical protein